MSKFVRWLCVASNIRGSRYLGDSVERKLAERLFARQNVTAMGCLGVFVAATTVYLRTNQAWFVVWGAVSIALMAGTIVVEASFRRRDPERPFVPWLRWYVARLFVSGILCGIGGSAASEVDDALTKLLLFGTWTAFVMGAASRNAALPVGGAHLSWSGRTARADKCRPPPRLRPSLFRAADVLVSRIRHNAGARSLSTTRRLSVPR
jgi:hypothetical protein